MVDYPKDWKEIKLGNISLYKNGDALEDKIVKNGIFNVITLNSIGIDGKLKKEHLRTNNNNSLLLKDDIVMVLSDVAHGYLLGLSDIIPENNKYVLNQRMGLLRITSNDYPMFIRLFINHNQEYFSKMGAGSSQKNLSKSSINKFKVYLPSIKEQKAIAETLMDFDKHIDNLEKLIEKKKMIRDGAVEDLMTGKVRLDGFEDEWEEVNLGDSVSIVRGASPRPIENHLTLDVDGINWIKIGDAPKNGKYINKTEEKIKKDSAIFSVLVNPGDFILSNSMSYGRPYIVKNRGCIHDGWLKLFGFDKKLNDDYLFYLLSLDNIQVQYRALAAGSGVKNLNKEIVKKVKIKIPTDIKEQEAIASILTSMDEEIENLEKEKAKIEKIKDGAMDDLLTGRVRLI